MKYIFMVGSGTHGVVRQYVGRTKLLQVPNGFNSHPLR